MLVGRLRLPPDRLLPEPDCLFGFGSLALGILGCDGLWEPSRSPLGVFDMSTMSLDFEGYVGQSALPRRVCRTYMATVYCVLWIYMRWSRKCYEVVSQDSMSNVLWSIYRSKQAVLEDNIWCLNVGCVEVSPKQSFEVAEIFIPCPSGVIRGNRFSKSIHAYCCVVNGIDRLQNENEALIHSSIDSHRHFQSQ